MSISKKTTPAIVGRRLRRYLGALLALGFGATWWSFVPPTAAHAAAPAVARAPHAVEPVTRHAVEPTHKPAVRIAAMPRTRIHKRHRAKPPVVVPTPVIDPIVVPAFDPSSVANELETTPVPEPKVVIDPDYIRIRTRSSS